MFDTPLEIQKRHTLNWLIQGAAQHAAFTFHHVVRDELNALDVRLLPSYDHFALLASLQYWNGLSVLMSGWPARFWKRAASDPNHPFFDHPLLSKYGGMLAEAARQRARERCAAKQVRTFPFVFSFKIISLYSRLRALEYPHRARLVQLAKQTASVVWGIPIDRLHAELRDTTVVPGDQFVAHNFEGRILRRCVAGYGGVVQRDHKLIVAAIGTNWLVLAKELVTGTAELICLHGLRQLDDDTYSRVINVTDRIDLEPWMLQSGGELWRRLLAALPDGCSMAGTMMNLACLQPAELESVLVPVIEQSQNASHRLAAFTAP